MTRKIVVELGAALLPWAAIAVLLPGCGGLVRTENVPRFDEYRAQAANEPVGLRLYRNRGITRRVDQNQILQDLPLFIDLRGGLSWRQLARAARVRERDDPESGEQLAVHLVGQTGPDVAANAPINIDESYQFPMILAERFSQVDSAWQRLERVNLSPTINLLHAQSSRDSSIVASISTIAGVEQIALGTRIYNTLISPTPGIDSLFTIRNTGGDVRNVRVRGRFELADSVRVLGQWFQVKDASQWGVRLTRASGTRLARNDPGDIRRYNDIAANWSAAAEAEERFLAQLDSSGAAGAAALVVCRNIRKPGAACFRPGRDYTLEFMVADGQGNGTGFTSQYNFRVERKNAMITFGTGVVLLLFFLGASAR